MKSVLAMCAVLCCGAAMLAQDKPAAAKSANPKLEKPAQSSSGMPPAPKASPEMQKLNKMLVGKWTAVVKTEAAPGMAATESKGEAIFRRGPGGLSLIEDFHSKGGMGSFYGHGVTYWDDKAKNYTGLWCDTMSAHGCENGGTSKWEGDKIVGFMEMEDNGKMQKYRMTYSDIKPDSVTFTMEAPDSKGSYTPMMTIVYTRAASPGSAAAQKQ